MYIATTTKTAIVMMLIMAELASYLSVALHARLKMPNLSLARRL